MSLWWIIVGMGLITFGLRLSLIAVAGRLAIPPIVANGLRYTPASVLSAVIFTEVLQLDGRLDLSAGNARLIGGFAAVLVAYRTKNVVLTIATGMAVLWLMQWLGTS